MFSPPNRFVIIWLRGVGILQVLKAEEIIDMENYELDTIEIDLAEVELEKKRVKNLREKTALTLKLIDQGTIVYYHYPPRPAYEVLGGYKKAIERGAELARVKIFNLYFRFFNDRLDGRSTAMMFRDKPERQEYILLLPDNTEATYEQEKRFYLNKARKMVLEEFTMEPDEHSRLIENLNNLNRVERCAQSIQHEWGHILHYRFFDMFRLKNKSEQLKWFYESGYVDILDMRYPGLGHHNADEVLYLIKESFAEDIRISLNNRINHDMFILPNAITYIRDFQIPKLLEDGVNLVGNIILSQEQEKSRQTATQSISGEINRVYMGHKVAERNLTYPEFSRTISPALIHQFIDDLAEQEIPSKNRPVLI